MVMPDLYSLLRPQIFPEQLWGWEIFSLGEARALDSGADGTYGKCTWKLNLQWLSRFIL